MLRAIDEAIAVLPLAIAGDFNDAMKQLHTELAFQLADLSAQRRLPHAEPLSGARDMPFLGNSDEIAEMPQLHWPQPHTQ